MSLTADGSKNPVRRRRADGEDNDDVAVKRDKVKPSRLESCLDQPVDSHSVHEVVQDVSSPLPDKHYDGDTTEPISCGLQTLDELLSWKLSEGNPFNVAAVPLAPREPPLASCPRRTLVSHDMMGGYLDDRFVQGTSSDAPYTFYHWHYIDVFNYFSHNLVTVPPAVWTNAAHKHGVTVIGTFITEWADGATMCESFLKDEESYRAIADKLVQISHFYGFDGWLINIENPLSEAAVKNTPLFLQYLTEQMHERVAGSVVLWYDSVIHNGQLKWQNELNPSNRMFFDACDGFFTNYNWTETNLELMGDYSEIQSRRADVYIGVDVFARGDVVGGKFETNKALELIRKHDFSAAIFAPGWVYESHDDKTEFCNNQDKFWSLLSDHLYVHRPASLLPFISSFCQGFGKTVYCRGQPETQRSWFNLAAQELQPLYYHTEWEGPGWLRSRGCSQHVWNGGSSLLLEGLVPVSHTSPVCARILSLHVPLPSETLLILIYKVCAGVSLSVELKTTDANNHTDITDDTLTSVSPTLLRDGHQLVSHFSQLSNSSNPDGWTVRFWHLDLGGCTLREVYMRIQQNEELRGTTPFSCRVGEIMLLDAASLQVPSEQVQGLCIYDVVWLRGAGDSLDSSPPTLHLNATLRWKYPAELVRFFRVYWRRLRGPDPRSPPGQLVLVGRAYSDLFRVTELAVSEPPGLLELVVEPVIKTGLGVPESQWGRRSLSYSDDLKQ